MAHNTGSSAVEGTRPSSNARRYPGRPYGVVFLWQDGVEDLGKDADFLRGWLYRCNYYMYNDEPPSSESELTS
uniref:Uncharacterized protein n=1 Tax=Leersia perrieri TaxID=77586 RepID=A0A0D9UWB2_9ORYZ